MHRSLKLAAAASILGAAAWLACGQPTPPGTETLLVIPSPASIRSDGSGTQITISATDANGAAGTGTVSLTAAAGSLGGGGRTATVTLSSNGSATITFACNRATDAGCNTSPVRIDASWAVAGKTVTSFANVTLTGGTADSGTPDSGTPDSGTPDSGSSSGGLSLVPNRTRMFAGINDFVDVVATLMSQPDGGGTPVANATLAFGSAGTASVLLGFPVDGGAGSATYNTMTNAQGRATVRVFDNGSAQGTSARVTGNYAVTMATAFVDIDVSAVQQIRWVSTKCAGPSGQVDCTILGIRNSGFQEQAQVTFSVVDTLNRPVLGVPLRFTISNPPSGTTVSPAEAITRADGTATTTVISGPVIGSFAVTASIGSASVDSPNIGIRGAKASNNGFSFRCSPVNLGAYASPNPPFQLPSTCDVKLVDRFNNPVGTGTSVNLKVEAGTIPSSAATRAFNPSPGADNSQEGTVQVAFDTRGAFPPPDVVPLPADPAQWPAQRFAEPSITAGAGVIKNPRDGLVTVIAYLRGEEYFDDNNGNGMRDASERFIDQGEPFVDSDDNGVWNPGELFVDEAPADGVWNPPNGTWDNTTTIWAETRILYTGRPVADPNYSFLVRQDGALPAGQFSGSCGSGVPKATRVTVLTYCADLNLNRAQTAQTSFSASHFAMKGTVAWGAGVFLDGYGFGIERKLLDATTSQDCTPTSQRCLWRYLFYGWDRGYSGWATVDGAPISDMNPCAPDTLTVGCTVLGQTLLVGASGAIE